MTIAATADAVAMMRMTPALAGCLELFALKQRCDVRRFPRKCERVGGTPERQDGWGRPSRLHAMTLLAPSCRSAYAENAVSCALF
jgi:hypothetical protein